MEIQQTYVECPHCKKWHAHSELLSYTTLGNPVYWSDGKCEKDETLEHASIPYSKCTKCENFFWFEDCRKITDYEIREHINPPKNEFVEKQIVTEFLKNNLKDYNENNLELNYPPSHWYWGDIPTLFIEDFAEILKNANDLAPKREIYIRTNLWQYINGFVRNSDNFFMQILKNTRKKAVYKRSQYKEYEIIRLENLNLLSKLLYKAESSENEETEVKIIEIERELGNFGKAKSLIDNLDPIHVHGHQIFVQQSLNLIAKKSTKIFKIT